MHIQISYVGKLQTSQIIKDLFPNTNPYYIQHVHQKITPTFYQFHIIYQHTQKKQEYNKNIYSIYRTHDEIQRFLYLYNKKAKQLKKLHKLDFDTIRTENGLKQIAEFVEMELPQWYKQFFDISHNIPGKKYSANLRKQSGGRYSQYKCCLCIKWKKCKTYILNDGVVTYDQSKNKVQQFMHFGKDFFWEISDNFQQHLIYIHSYHRKMTLQADKMEEFFIFVYCLEKYMRIYKREQMEYRFNSFAPVRKLNNVEFYVDGADYFQAVAHAIQAAQEQVFICGWWISPQFNLVRPCIGTNLDYRLDKLLALTAKKGIKIYIVVYYQSSFLTNDSQYTISALQSLHPHNIKVLRHPQIVLPTFWSHHEKLVVIDQSIAFLGGLDMCYGRYDNKLHLINQSSIQFYPGIQYNNCRIADFIQVKNYQKQIISRNLPRLPWHDIALMVKGPCVKDLSRHFIQYWNYASYQTHFAERYVLISQSNKNIPHKKPGFIDSIKDVMQEIKCKINKEKRYSAQIQPNKNKNSQLENNHEQMLTQMTQEAPHCVPPRKTHPIQNAFNKIKPKPPSLDLAQIQHKKQSPSSQLMYLNTENRSQIKQNIHIQDIQSQIKNEKNSQLYQSIQKKQYALIKKQQSQMKQTLNCIQRIQTQLQNQQNLDIQQKIQQDYLQENSKKVDPQTIPKRMSLQFIQKFKQKIHNKFVKPKNNQSPQTQHKKGNKFHEESITQNSYTCQVLRSVSQWSIGSKQHEHSIYDAYLSLISISQKYIYIENQFFISATHMNGVVKNRIMEQISKRIIRAIENQENFKVIIFMPLIPGFAGELDDPSASLPRVIMNWQYKTQCKGQDSLIGRISKYTDNPHKYIQFFGLRTHGLIGETPITQIIYLHSKLMIVDDRYLICGSANINDRSMLGNRDSQLCLLIQSQPKLQIKIDNQPYLVVQKIHKLRAQLWQEHFGIPTHKVKNPTSQQLWVQLTAIATNNTMIYKKLFGCYPDNDIKKLEDIKKYKKIFADKKQYDREAYKIQGHAVLIPLQFLEDEKLTSYHPHAIST